MGAKSRMTSKGQVTVPKEVRIRLGLISGDEIEFIEDERGFRVQKRLQDSPFEQWRGYLKEFSGRRSDELVEEMRGK